MKWLAASKTGLLLHFQFVREQEWQQQRKQKMNKRKQKYTTGFSFNDARYELGIQSIHLLKHFLSFSECVSLTLFMYQWIALDIDIIYYGFFFCTRALKKKVEAIKPPKKYEHWIISKWWESISILFSLLGKRNAFSII